MRFALPHLFPPSTYTFSKSCPSFQLPPPRAPPSVLCLRCNWKHPVGDFSPLFLSKKILFFSNKIGRHLLLFLKIFYKRCPGMFSHNPQDLDLNLLIIKKPPPGGGGRIKVPIAFPYLIPPSRSSLNKLKRLSEATCDMKCPLGGHPPEIRGAGGGQAGLQGPAELLQLFLVPSTSPRPAPRHFFFLSFFFEKI